jgi:hypothetical protein
MRKHTFVGLLAAATLAACGNSTGPTGSTPPPPPAEPQFEITTLITVYRSASSDAMWSRATTTDERIGELLLGVDDLSSALGSTNLNNEAAREDLQAAIDRVNEQFTDADYRTAFDETRGRLERFLNDADNDGWSIDGRHGVGRDWPFDGRGNRNDPDGWTAQIVVTVTEL